MTDGRKAKIPVLPEHVYQILGEIELAQKQHSNGAEYKGERTYLDIGDDHHGFVEILTIEDEGEHILILNIGHAKTGNTFPIEITRAELNELMQVFAWGHKMAA